MTMESKTLNPSQFSFAITKVAVSQICQSIGFKASQNSALETLTDIATRYLQALAESASSHAAASSGRTHSNLFDLIHALQHLNSTQGFPGASNINQTLLNSSTLTDIIRFVNSTDEIPFAKPIQQHFRSNFSIVFRKSKCGGGVDLNSTNSRYSHIPRWLPSLPDPSTYERVGTPSVTVERCCEAFVVEKRVDKEREKERFELPVERERVRLKFKVGERGLGFGVGVDMKNGVCRGGKRVSWHNRKKTKII